MRLLLMFCVLAMVGCASAPKTTQELNINCAKITVATDETKVVIDGPSGKGSGAVAGGAKGAGVGVGTVAVLSTACGPWYLFCLIEGSILVGAPVGGVMGAAYGSATSEDSDRVKEKQAMLTEALVDLDASQSLAPLVYKKSHESSVILPSQEDNTSVTADSGWMLRIALDEFATIGSGLGEPYSLQLSASVDIISTSDKKPAFSKGYLANSSLQMTTAEWRANDDEPVRFALEDLLATLATEISNDLKPIQLSLEKPVEDYKVYVQPMSTETNAEPVAVLKTSQSPTPVKQEAYNPDQTNLFDPTTGMNWIVVPTTPVNLGTANSLCGSLEARDKKRYRVPSLGEFEDLWKKYKNDKHISIFKKREYCTSSREDVSMNNRTKIFSFAIGNSEEQYAAYLTCVGK